MDAVIAKTSWHANGTKPGSKIATGLLVLVGGTGFEPVTPRL